MLLSSLNNSHILRLTGPKFKSCLYENKGFAPSVEVIQDDYLKEKCSPGSYGLNPGRMQLDRLIHCWSFFWVPYLGCQTWPIYTGVHSNYLCALVCGVPRAPRMLFKETTLLCGWPSKAKWLKIPLVQRFYSRDKFIWLLASQRSPVKWSMGHWLL